MTGPGKTVEKRGEGLGAGPVGDAGGYKDRKQQGRGSGTRAGGGGGILNESQSSASSAQQSLSVWWNERLLFCL